MPKPFDFLHFSQQILQTTEGRVNSQYGKTRIAIGYPGFWSGDHAATKIHFVDYAAGI